ncbi:MAG: hypothetical protein ABWY92_05210 [Xanthobacteraceae bacterium]
MTEIERSIARERTVAERDSPAFLVEPRSTRRFGCTHTVLPYGLNAAPLRRMLKCPDKVRDDKT